MTTTSAKDLPSRIRICSVPYLNAAPLTRGLEDEIVFLPPSQLGAAIRDGKLDVALLSITEALFNPGYRILDGIGVCSRGPVGSVFLAHSMPLEDLTEIHCDPASLTSVNLLRVLLRRRGIEVNWKLLESYEEASKHANVLLIGNPAIQFRSENQDHEIWDLGEAWDQEMQLPFVYAVWVLRHDLSDARLVEKLREAKDRGTGEIDHIIPNYPEFDASFRQQYLTENIHYELGDAEKRGIARFIHELRQVGHHEVFDADYICHQMV